jgi:DNA-binding HxlR family transcriptional regulator
MRKETSTNQLNKKSITSGCPLTATVMAVSGRWKIIILWQLKHGALRYNQIKKSISNISEKVLIQQLKELIEDGWISKKDYQSIPPHTEYSLTELSSSFMPILETIYDWGTQNNMVERIENVHST